MTPPNDQGPETDAVSAATTGTATPKTRLVIPIRERETRVRIPEGGALPQSAALLERLYRDELVPREKKPMVVDTRRSWSAYMASVDERPLVVLDACSQIATLTHGFGHPAMRRAVYAGRFDGCLWSNPDTRVRPQPEVEDYTKALVERAPPGLTHVSLVCAGGSEANEKALRIARLHAPPPLAPARPRTRVMAFQGSFHGRTMVPLMATWNPKKRGPFELPGFEARFAEPTLDGVERALDAHGDEVYAVIIEPMMAEGGDIHLARDFYAGLVERVRARGLPMIVDEVQTGFSTGGPFFWWNRLGLDGDPATAPDLITIAKKANVGVVVSRWPDPELAHNNVPVVAALRGLIQLETAHEQNGVEARIGAHLEGLAAAFPGVVTGARVAGTTFAFELPDTDARDAFVAQRFQRGFMVYGAGERTIRFRLGATWNDALVADLFARIRAAIERLNDPAALTWSPEGYPEAGEDPPAARIQIRAIEETDWTRVIEIERDSYEAARRDSEAYLRRIREGGLGLVAVDETGTIVGFCFGGPIENYRDIVGPAEDPAQGKGTVFYSVDVTVAEGARGRGVGRALKRAQVAWAQEQGFHFMSGRNRVGATDSMMALNRSFGAYTVRIIPNQYEGETDAEYYHIPLVEPQRPEPRPRTRQDADVDLASGIQQPFGPLPSFMAARELIGPLTSKLNLSNYSTPDVIDYVDHLRDVLPRGMKHLYFTTSRDETVDKGLRCLRLTRTDARIAVGIEGGYVGHITGAARSISDPAGFGPDLSLFGWPRLPHPAAEGGPEATVAALDRVVETHGAEHLFGLVAEVVGERSGLVLEGDAVVALAAACRRHDIPLVLVETATGGYRCGDGPWGVDALPPGVIADMVLWYPGGQLGHVFVGDRYWISKPLTLISTWDGDEVSVIRTHEHLRAAAGLPQLAEACAALGALLEGVVPAHFAGTRVGGRGLYRTLTFEEPQDAVAVRAACRARGLWLGEGVPGTLVVAPPLDITPDAISAFRRPFNKALADAAGRDGKSG